jgi:CHAD domain-containing protein
MDRQEFRMPAGDDETQAIERPPAAPAPRWKKAARPAIAADASAEDALAVIVRGCVQHMKANEACVLARSHVEGVHQMRVAARRLRSSLSLYRDMLPDDQRRFLGAELRWLVGALGLARDWDVFFDETLAPVRDRFPREARLKDLEAEAGRARDAAYVRAQEALRSPRYTGLKMLLGAWTDGRHWHDGAAPDARQAMRRPAVEVASRLIDAHYRAMLSAGHGFEALSAKERHDLRIDIKKLRYATEFFASLYWARRLSPYLAALKALQDRLGAENDVAVARGLMLRLVRGARGRRRGRIGYAAGLIVGWHSHVSQDREDRLRPMWHRLVARTPFWDVPAAMPAPQDAPAADAPPQPAPQLNEEAPGTRVREKLAAAEGGDGAAPGPERR